MKAVDWLVRLAFLTASFDVILTLHVGGTIRFAQAMMIVVGLCALGRMAQTGKILWPRGGYALLAWTVLQGLFISESIVPGISLQLYLLLLFSIIGIFALLQLYGRSVQPEVLMRSYLWSYVLVAAFGLIQFITPILHLGGILVVQWVIHDRFARISGFNYEPSYFATYLIMGWVMVIDLRVSGARITHDRKWWYFAMLLTIVFFLSTSKTAWIFIIVEAIARVAPLLWRRFSHRAHRLSQGNLSFPGPRLRTLLIPAFVLLSLVAGYRAISKVLDPSQFLSGTGIANTPAHSLNDRMRAFQDTVAMYKEHPWIGRSLGGTSARVAELEGASIHTVDDLRAHWAFPVPLDLLASSGIIGILPFLWFSYRTTYGENRMINEHWDDDRAKWLHALNRALLYEWLCLLADQNVVRVYLWFHIGMVVVIGYNLRFVPARRPLPSASGELAAA